MLSLICPSELSPLLQRSTRTPGSSQGPSCLVRAEVDPLVQDVVLASKTLHALAPAQVDTSIH